MCFGFSWLYRSACLVSSILFLCASSLVTSSLVQSFVPASITSPFIGSFTESVLYTIVAVSIACVYVTRYRLGLSAALYSDDITLSSHISRISFLPRISYKHLCSIPPYFLYHISDITACMPAISLSCLLSLKYPQVNFSSF